MNLTRASSVIVRQFYLLRGSPARVLPLFAWVAIDMLLWGFMTRYLNTITPGSTFNFVPALLGAVLLWDFFSRVMYGVATAFFEDVWSRNFLNVFASPLSIPEYLAGLVATAILTSAIGLLVMYVVATAFFGLSFASYGAAILPFLLILFLFGIALGIVGVAVVLRFGPPAEWFVWPIPALISPFVGVFYPLSVLPRPMQYVSHLLPPAYVFEGVRSIVAGHGVSAPLLLLGAALAILYILLACWLFTAVFRHAVRTGLIARYSAESIS
jgi:ABC-2 type transport system permease protein